MDNTTKITLEIGLFEASINLAKVAANASVIEKVGAFMPLPDEGIETRAELAVDWILGSGKKKYMFLTPEIALIERMAERCGSDTEVIIAVPCDLEEDAKERLKNNLPRKIAVTVLEEPYFPQSFLPGNGMIVICGYLGGSRAMVLPDTYRMAEHYSGFLGKKVFVPYKELDTAARYANWMELSQNRINAKWRCA